MIVRNIRDQWGLEEYIFAGIIPVSASVVELE
jgi:hypothetical protein